MLYVPFMHLWFFHRFYLHRRVRVRQILNRQEPFCSPQFPLSSCAEMKPSQINTSACINCARPNNTNQLSTQSVVFVFSPLITGEHLCVV